MHIQFKMFRINSIAMQLNKLKWLQVHADFFLSLFRLCSRRRFHGLVSNIHRF